jgi:P27 family predicted phage terminase small subunit
MGKRGPIAGATYGQKPGRKPNPERSERSGTAKRSPSRRLAPVRSLEIVSSDGRIPEAPDHLGDLGRRVWADIWVGFPGAVLNDQLDYFTVQRLCEAAEERELYRGVLEKLGPVLVEPIVSPRGNVVGERAVINPAEAALRRLDKQIAADSDRLGLSPSARARLGLVVSKAQLAAADASALIAKMRRPTGGA